MSEWAGCIAILVTVTIVVWAIWWLNQEGGDGPDRFGDAAL